MPYVPGDNLGDDELSGFKLKLPKISLKGLKSTIKGTGKLLAKAAPVASFIPGLNIIAAPVAVATKAASLARADAPNKKAAAPAPVVRASEATAAKAQRPRKPIPVKAVTAAPAAVVRAADTTAAKAAKKPLIKAPTASTATAAEKAATAKKVVGIGARIRAAATTVAAKVKAAKGKADQLATKADTLAKAGDLIGAKKFAAEAASVAESARNAGAQLEQNIAPAIEQAGVAAQGATEGAVARVGFESIPKPLLFGVGGLLLLGGAYLVTRKKGKAA
jgi:hypothetical protein